MKFSVRDLLLVTVIVALAVAWRRDHRRLVERLSSRRFTNNQVELFDPSPRLPNSSASVPEALNHQAPAISEPRIPAWQILIVSILALAGLPRMVLIILWVVMMVS